MLLSGAVENLDQARGKQRNRMLTTEEIELADLVRQRTPPHALFVVGLQHNHPVPMLTGRRVLLGYGGWLWSQGIDFKKRQVEERFIFELRPDAAALIERHHVDYVVIGPNEKTSFNADPEAWRARYPSILKTDSYEVFSVAPSPAATGATPARPSTSEAR
jgi:hypothetical protein